MEEQCHRVDMHEYESAHVVVGNRKMWREIVILT